MAQQRGGAAHFVTDAAILLCCRTRLRQMDNQRENARCVNNAAGALFAVTLENAS
jgi:hypothetical protein